MYKKDKEPNPERQARRDTNPQTNDAFCTECTVWYNSSKTSEVNKHAH